MMKSNFLNLPSSATGDARRHVPFRSIINKHFSILFVLVFVFSIMFSYIHPVAALADPVFEPVYDTQFYQLPQFVDPLNSIQTDIFYFTLGSQVVEYAGLSGFQVENPYSDPQSVGEWFKKIGYDLYNDVLESFAIAGAPIVAAGKWSYNLFANIAGAANFAGKFDNTSFNSFLNDVEADGLNLKTDPSLLSSLNQYFAYNNGLYDWQYHQSDFITDLTHRTVSLPSTSNYWTLYENLNPPIVRCNAYNWSNTVSNSDFFVTYHYGFFNTSNGYLYLVDSNGECITDNVSQVIYINLKYLLTDSNTLDSALVTNNSINIYPIVQYSNYNFNNYIDAVQYFIDNVQLFNNTFNFFVSDFVTNWYYGSSWDNKTEIFNNTNLNFDNNPSQYYEKIISDHLLDIKGLINDLLDTIDLKQPVLDNVTDLNGDPLPATELQPVSVAVELPDSGITINSGLFTPITKDGGYINYLWYMTKPLVQYTSDFIQTLVFPDDTGEGFDATGPGVIVFGVISLGLIGGLVVKCLL